MLQITGYLEVSGQRIAGLTTDSLEVSTVPVKSIPDMSKPGFPH